MSHDWCTATAGGVRLAVQVMPNARKTEIAGVLDGILKIRLKAPPVGGKANEALVRYLADVLSVPKSAVAITHGLSNKRKLLAVHAPGNISVDSIMSILLNVTAAG